jgi:hypothetical protein
VFSSNLIKHNVSFATTLWGHTDQETGNNSKYKYKRSRAFKYQTKGNRPISSRLQCKHWDLGQHAPTHDCGRVDYGSVQGCCIRGRVDIGHHRN